MYDLDRREASRLLNVSTRTVDRYVKAGRLSTRITEGRVYLDTEEIQLFKRAKNAKVFTKKVGSVDKANKTTVDTSIDVSTGLKKQLAKGRKRVDIASTIDTGMDRVDKVGILGLSTQVDTVGRSIKELIEGRKHEQKKWLVDSDIDKIADVDKIIQRLSTLSTPQNEIMQIRDRLEFANYEIAQLKSHKKNSIELLEHFGLLQKISNQTNALRTEVRYQKLVNKILTVLIFFLLILIPIIALIASE